MSSRRRPSILLDSSPSRSALRSRRQTLGGSDFPVPPRSETSQKDRHAMLDEWRRQRNNDTTQQKIRLRDTALSDEENTVNSSAKRARIQKVSTRPPCSAKAKTFEAAGTTALERFRMRKQLKLQQQQQSQMNNTENILLSSNSNSMPSSICYTDDDDETVYQSGVLSNATPGRSTRGRLSAKASRRRSFSAHALRSRTSDSTGLLRSNNRQPLLPPQQPQQQESLSQLTTESDPLPGPSRKMRGDNQGEELVGAVEGAALRSQLREMKQRIEHLEKEKMELSMNMAPMESRIRQQQEDWSKENSRLLQELETKTQESREADERYRDIELKYGDLEQECKHLRLEVRKASSSLNSRKAKVEDSAWDRQLQNDRDVLELKEKLRSANDNINSIQLEKVSVEKELHATKIELESLARSYDEIQEEYDEIAKSTSDNREAEIQLEVLSNEHEATVAQLNAVCADLAATKARAEATLEEKEAEHRQEVEQLHFDMSVLKTRARDLPTSTASDDVEDEAVLRARIEERDRRIIELEGEVRNLSEVRRQMHNRIQELRGNIRVFVRTRPFLPSDGKADESAIDVSPDGESIDIQDSRSVSPHSFKFDKVFPPSAGQDLVFQEVADFVQSALDGYNVCLFSYGQTGSGKTHTMQGSGNGCMRGVIPRAVEQILEQAKKLQSQKWSFALSASFLEIYNEELKDLLVSISKKQSSGGKENKLSIKRSREGKSYVDGLTETKIETTDAGAGMQQLNTLMAAAARSRSVASTKMNAQSSRSHSVFMLHLHGYNEETGAVVQGSLNLCDLAGSERLDRSGANSDMKRLRETQAINKSLSCLGDVFTALGNRASHVPFRNSKLTYLLQDCLSGDGKALMFVNLSPTTKSSGESLCSLRFAQRVNQVELGKPTKHIQYKK